MSKKEQQGTEVTRNPRGQTRAVSLGCTRWQVGRMEGEEVGEVLTLN
jgi:hypothetical protein